MEIICLIYCKFPGELKTPLKLAIAYIYFRIRNQALLAVLIKLLAPMNITEKGTMIYEGPTLC